MIGVATERPHACPGPVVRSDGTRDDHRSFGHDQRLPRLRFDDPLVRQIVDRRGPGKDGARSEHRAALDDRSLVDAAIAADEHVVFDDDRQRAHRLDARRRSAQPR